MLEEHIQDWAQYCLKAHERGKDRETPPSAPDDQNGKQGSIAQRGSRH
jgi:hypothetical protein